MKRRTMKKRARRARLAKWRAARREYDATWCVAETTRTRRRTAKRERDLRVVREAIETQRAREGGARR